MIEEIEFKEMKDFSEYNILEDIQEDAWGMPIKELVPKRLMYATLKSGGVVIGAYKGEEIIGYCWGWVGRMEKNEFFIYSHHNAVRTEYQNSGIGYNLKLKQREWALDHGYEFINWTFDPLQSKNCYLNFHKLGVICNSYNSKYWGDMHDNLNRGIDTDRFYCNWILNSEEVQKHINQDFTDYSKLSIHQKYHTIETEMEEAYVGIRKIKLDLELPVLFARIPPNFQEILENNIDLIKGWREKTREVFTTYFQKGYKVVDFVIRKIPDVVDCFHVMKKSDD
jgi:predicted GNAT superfamily acetyltransferase